MNIEFVPWTIKQRSQCIRKGHSQEMCTVCREDESPASTKIAAFDLVRSCLHDPPTCLTG